MADRTYDEVMGLPKPSASPRMSEIEMLVDTYRDEVFQLGFNPHRAYATLEECLADKPEAAALAARTALLTAIRVLETERDKAREFVAFCITDGSFQGLDIDGGDAQDKAMELGLIVEVPADEEFYEEHGYDRMMVLAWTDAASRSTEPVPAAPLPSNRSLGDPEMTPR